MPTSICETYTVEPADGGGNGGNGGNGGGGPIVGDDVYITNCEVSIQEVAVGEESVVYLDIQNDWSTPVEVSYELHSNGNLIDTGTQSIDATNSASIPFTISFPSTGSYDISADLVNVSETSGGDTGEQEPQPVIGFRRR